MIWHEMDIYIFVGLYYYEINNKALCALLQGGTPQ